MRPVFYDLHLHSCLSPCGDMDMTPNNIVNMSLLKGLELIALTDHNSCKNCPATLAVAGQAGLAVIPGMELPAAEEINVVCLFPTLEAAMGFDRYVHDRLAPVKNAPEIFGEQWVLDELDQPVAQEELLLINATTIGISQAPAAVAAFGGLCYPAHIDRSSNSVLANLGFLPPECGFTALEVKEPEKFFAGGANGEYWEGYHILSSSDAHYLEQINERERCLHLETADFWGLKTWIDKERA